MRSCNLYLVLLLVAASAAAQGLSTPGRYEVPEELVKYPQQTPQQTMQSVAKILAENDLDYLLAHLTDPAFVDGKVKEYAKLYKGPPKSVELVAFQKLVKEVRQHFVEDPMLVGELSRFGKEGIWEIDAKKGKASAKLPDVASRRAYLVFSNTTKRWYLENQR